MKVIIFSFLEFFTITAMPLAILTTALLWIPGNRCFDVLQEPSMNWN